MTKNEIRKDIKNRINRLGVKNAYLEIVVTNARVIQPQLSLYKTSDMQYLVQMAHSISVNSIKSAGMIDSFKKLFYSDNVIHDYVYDESIDLIINSIEK
ncbi:hypothetical protein [Brevibacillus sp. NRS-1366]|uniref:hypothetical protein n=1 Tax=Brevibacillus sp. NRS-1366 TaxID=3233899 RepID=UPI003D236CDF